MRPFILPITEKFKKHPIVSFIFAILPLLGFTIGVSSWVTRLAYTKTISEYQRKTVFQELEINKLNQQINALKFPGGGSTSNSRSDQSKDLSGNNLSENINSSIVTLVNGKPHILFDADVKLLLSNLSAAIKNVSFDAIIDGKRHNIDLYFDELETVISGPYEYTFNLLKYSDYEAEVLVKRIRIQS